MKTPIAILMILASAAHAQLITTYDYRLTNMVASQYQAVDVGNTDPITNPDYRDYNAMFPLRSVGTPALINLRLKLGVTITGSMANARADIRRMDDERRPAKVALETFLGGQTPKQFRKSLKAAYSNVRTNTAFNAAQRTVLTNMLWAVGAEDDFAELRQAKQAEDIDLGIKKEDAP